jgi:hypothetical protein
MTPTNWITIASGTLGFASADEESDARLIALAPEMAALLADMADVISDYIDDFPQDKDWADTDLLARLDALLGDSS